MSMSSALPQVPSRSLNDTGDRQKYDINNIEHSKLEDGPDPEVHETAFVNLSKWQVVKKFWRATIFCYMCTFGIIMDGFQASLPGGIVANPGFVAVYGTLRTATGAPALNPQHLSAWAGTQFAGQILGAFMCAPISDRFGRKAGMAFMTLMLAGGIVIEMVGYQWTHWLAAKMLIGLGIGAQQGIMVPYIAEIAPAQIRGTLSTSYAWGIALGQLLAAVALQIVAVTDSTNYKKAIYSEWVPLGSWVILFCFMPETPWFYVRRDNEVKAKQVMARIYRGVEGYDVDREYSVMAAEIERERQEKQEKGWEVITAYKDLFMGTNLKRTFGGVFGLAAQKWSGSSVVFSYTTYFFQQAGIPNPFQANVIVYCILIGAVGSSFYSIERFGRRALLLSCGTVACLLNTIIGTMGVITQSEASRNATLGIICLWVANYAIGIAATGYVLAGEVGSPRLRAKTASFVSMSNSIAGCIYDTTVPMMLANTGFGAQGWGLKTLYMFAILSGVGVGINYLMIPETKGRTFNELDEMYEARVPPRKMKAYITKVEQSGLKAH